MPRIKVSRTWSSDFGPGMVGEASKWSQNGGREPHESLKPVQNEYFVKGPGWGRGFLEIPKSLSSRQECKTRHNRMSYHQILRIAGPCKE